MRNALEFEITAQPAAANFGSSLACNVRVHAGKNNLRRASSGPRPAATIIFAIRAGSGVSSRHFARLAIRLPARPVAGRKPRNLEPGMVFEQLNVTLADHSGRAKNANGKFRFHGLNQFSVQEVPFLLCVPIPSVPVAVRSFLNKRYPRRGFIRR